VGPNTIDIKKPFILSTILREFSKPFYTYQLFMLWAWYPFYYYHMAFIQTIIVVSGGLSVSFFSYRNERNLYRLSRVSGNVSVLRDGNITVCSQDELVPGDVVEIKPGTVYADMIILTTDVVIVDESALTGESTPMAKSAIDLAESQSVFKQSAHKKYCLSAGTTCLEVSAESFALVLSTGSYTAKGELLRDVLSFRRHKFKFDTQVNLVVLILACYAIFGFVLSCHYYQDLFAYEFFYGM
jgi:P-type E1-E2 ATPase